MLSRYGRVRQALGERVLIGEFVRGAMGRGFEFVEKGFFVRLSLIVIGRRGKGGRRSGRVGTYLIQLQETPVGQIVQGDRLVGEQSFHDGFDLADPLTVGW